jgi:DNA-binding beta-propeller fold protein YncE
VTRNKLIVAIFVVALGALGITRFVLQEQVQAQGPTVTAPRFEVDPFWPKPLPNHWVLGSAIGVWVDERDHVWMIHRSSDSLAVQERAAESDEAECCEGAPPVLEFDADGNLVGSWGGPGEGYEWPQSNHGIFVDHLGNVWIGGNGGGDSHILKFTRTGEFLAQYGMAGAHRSPGDEGADDYIPTYGGDSSDMQNFGRVAKVVVDPTDNEAYVADGYLNKRVAVLDGDTGEMKRFWGAYGNVPDDTNLGPYDPDAAPAQQFRNPVHCADVSADGLVYVCDRANDRLQVFQKDGTFVKEGFIAKETLASGSVWDLAFSRDEEQRYLFVVDGMNQRIHVVLRDTLEEVTSFGDGGRQPGQFYGVHSIAIDAAGNLYTTETWEGKRIQKFVYMGMSEVPRGPQGTTWPTNSTQ